jgi:hypothetical protein
MDSFIENEKKEICDIFNKFIINSGNKKKEKIMSRMNTILDLLEEEKEKKVIFQKKLKAILSWRREEAMNFIIQLNLDNKMYCVKCNK